MSSSLANQLARSRDFVVFLMVELTASPVPRSTNCSQLSVIKGNSIVIVGFRNHSSCRLFRANKNRYLDFLEIYPTLLR